MMTATILAKQSDVSLYTVRHYTRIGLLKPSRNSSNNYKVYQPSDATRLHFIQAAKSLGFSLTEIKEILSEAKHGNSPCPMVREIIERHIEENRRKIKEMQKLQKKMESALTDWKLMDNSMPNGDSVCHLIESVAEVKKSA
ncbi:MAG: MerR family DNA-binding protein [Acidobacteriota bacterium]|jgi:DNA-binding transcriptional MerR regulator|nr:MerR family DNA-binding protein [Acidobacteriota bacterium]MDQ3087040.1 MerR family DNA-binding protein [Acidobacteriota bacterium]